MTEVTIDHWVANTMGKNAFLDGMKRADCPYNAGTQEHFEWHDGFSEQEKQHRESAEANNFSSKPFKVHYVGVADARLIAAVEAAQCAMNKSLSTNLYGVAWYLQQHKPKPWLYRKFTWLRRRLGEKIADLASFIAGYDVRGDW